MIYTTLTHEDAYKVIELGKRLHQESRFSNTKYAPEVIWRVLEETVQNPTKYFIVYSKNSSGDIDGFFLGTMGLEFFTGNLVAKDLGMYVVPELRGTRLFFRLLNAFESWAKDNQAAKIVLYHSTGIEPEKAMKMFPKLGYSHFGYMFDKELEYV